MSEALFAALDYTPYVADPKGTFSAVLAGEVLRVSFVQRPHYTYVHC